MGFRFRESSDAFARGGFAAFFASWASRGAFQPSTKFETVRPARLLVDLCLDSRTELEWGLEIDEVHDRLGRSG